MQQYKSFFVAYFNEGGIVVRVGANNVGIAGVQFLKIGVDKLAYVYFALDPKFGLHSLKVDAGFDTEEESDLMDSKSCVSNFNVSANSLPKWKAETKAVFPFATNASSECNSVFPGLKAMVITNSDLFPEIVSSP